MTHYTVDRILKKQRAEREAAEQVRREQAKELDKLVSDVSPEMPQHDAPPIATSTAKTVQGEMVASPSPSLPPQHPPPHADGDFAGRRPGSLFTDKLQNWGRKFAGGKTQDYTKGVPVPTGAGSPRPNANEPERHGARSPQPVTPHSNIGNADSIFFSPNDI